MLILCVVFIFLLMFWAFSSYAGQPGPNQATWVVVPNAVIPFLLFVILGYIAFSGIVTKSI